MSTETAIKVMNTAAMTPAAAKITRPERVTFDRVDRRPTGMRRW